MRTTTPYRAAVVLGLAAGLVGCDGAPGRPGATDGRLLALGDGGNPKSDWNGPTADHGFGPDAWIPGADSAAPGPEAGPSVPDTGPPPSPDSGLAPGDYDYTQHITFHQVAGTGKSCNPGQYGKYYCDVLTHTLTPYLSADTMTNIHETQHFMAHDYDGVTAAADKFIYLRDGKGAFFPEPQLKTQGIYDSIKYKGSIYNTYIAGRPGQSLGENIVDEWRAYLTEEIVAIQIAQLKGQGPGSISGLVLGGVQFLYYNAAMLHALQTKEPGFLTQNPQAVAVFAMLAEETKAWTLDQGVVPGLFFSLTNASAQAILAELRTGPQSAPIRTTIKALYGPKWATRVLGIN